jgi:hypothetical protein
MNEDGVGDGLPDVHRLSLKEMCEGPQTALAMALKRILAAPDDSFNGFQSSI